MIFDANYHIDIIVWLLGFKVTEHGITNYTWANTKIMVLITRNQSDLNNSFQIHIDSHLANYFPYRWVITHSGNNCFSNIMFGGIN